MFLGNILMLSMANVENYLVTLQNRHKGEIWDLKRIAWLANMN